MEVHYIIFKQIAINMESAKNKKISLKQHIRYFNFRSKIQLDYPVNF